MMLTQRYVITVLGWVSVVAMSLSLYPALSEHRYLLLGALIAAAVIGTGSVLRFLRAPASLVLPMQVVVLLEILQVGFGSGQRYGLVPTRATLTSIADLARGGFDTAQKYAAPAPHDPGLLLMVLLVIGLVAAVVDAFAVGLGRVPLAGLPLLAMYAVPVAALPDGVPFLFFLPGAASFIALITADERDRLAHWGRLVMRDRTEHARAVDLSSLRESGRRIGLAALSMAVVLPLFIPTVSSSIFGGNRSGGIGPGGASTLSFKDPMVSLANGLQRSEVVDLLDVTGDTVPQYLRLTVLDRPGPISWLADPVVLTNTMELSQTLPPPGGLGPDVATRDHEMTIDLGSAFPSDSGWLPVPFYSTLIGASSQFGYVPDDETVSVSSESALASLGPYKVNYKNVEPTQEQLRASSAAPPDVIRRDAVVPDGVPAIVGDTAREVTAGAQSPYEQAVLLQSFFHDQNTFTYDVDAGYGYGYDAMSDFLEQRRGFCQHFAATMAMMARTLGIPSRVVVGFLQPDHTNADGAYVITSHDAHAWPELYFGGVGWVRFEPTPNVGAPFPSYAPRTDAPTAPTSAAPGSASFRDPESSKAASDPVGGATPTNSAGGDGIGAVLPSSGWLVLIALALLVMLPWLLRWGTRRSRLSRPMDAVEAAEAAWTELRDQVTDLRLPWTGSMTPRAREQAVSQYVGADPEARAALRRLTLSVERARYASTHLPGADPATDVREVSAALARGVSRARRIQATVLPVSLLPDLRGGLEGARERLHRPGALSG